MGLINFVVVNEELAFRTAEFTSKITSKSTASIKAGKAVLAEWKGAASLPKAYRISTGAMVDGML
jgi:hypothetical protein